MIAKCIDDKSEEYPDFRGKLSSNKFSGITKDKLYEVEQSKLFDGYYEIIDDFNLNAIYKKERFEIMECLNKDCDFNIKDKCNHGIAANTSNDCFKCNKRIKPQHAPSYAEEQLEYAKEKEVKAYSLCYNKECQHFRKDNKCDLSMAIKCASYLGNPVNYEEEYKKLKEENEDLKERFNNQAESIESYIKENEKYRDYIKDSNKVFDKLTKDNEKLENTRDALVEENNEFKVKNTELQRKLGLLEAHNELFTDKIGKLNAENEIVFKENLGLKDKVKDIANKSLKKYDELQIEFKKIYTENSDLQKENEEFKAEINQLRDDVQKANFKLKEYDSKLPQLKELVVKLIRINEILASNIYVEGLED